MAYRQAKQEDITPGKTVYRLSDSTGQYKPHDIKSLSTYVSVRDRAAGMASSSLDNLNLITFAEGNASEFKNFNITFQGKGGEADYTRTGYIYKNGDISIITEAGEYVLYVTGRREGGGRRHRRKTKKARKHRRRHSRRN